MGVYIKGIEMPKNYEGCEVIIRIQPNGEVLDLHGIHIGATAIPVPPHGRLIDADEFLKRAFGTRIYRGDFWLALEELVGESPTIIPADEENTQ